MRTSELTGAMLNYWVARADGWEAEVRSYQQDPFGKGVVTVHYCNLKKGNRPFSPSTNWAQGGPIIERERIDINTAVEGWEAYCDIRQTVRGDTALEAAMRAYVTSKFGNEVQEGSESNG